MRGLITTALLVLSTVNAEADSNNLLFVSYCEGVFKASIEHQEETDRRLNIPCNKECTAAKAEEKNELDRVANYVVMTMMQLTVQSPSNTSLWLAVFNAKARGIADVRNCMAMADGWPAPSMNPEETVDQFTKRLTAEAEAEAAKHPACVRLRRCDPNALPF
jgi:hypothetical protein